MKIKSLFYLIFCLWPTLLWAQSADAPVLISPTDLYAGQRPHYDPLTTGKVPALYISNISISYDEYPDWHKIDVTDSARDLFGSTAFFWAYKEIPDLEERPDPFAWKPPEISDCLSYLQLAYRAKWGPFDDEEDSAVCHIRAALAALGFEPPEEYSEGNYYTAAILQALLDKLPYQKLRIGPSLSAEFPKHGLPDGAYVTWPVEPPHGQNVIRLEWRFPLTKEDRREAAKMAYRVGNGMLCAPNWPCICEYSPSCETQLVGLIADWTDAEGNAHWFVSGYGLAHHYGAMSEGGSTTYFWHIIREPGKEPYIDEQLDEKITAFIENQ